MIMTTFDPDRYLATVLRISKLFAVTLASQKLEDLLLWVCNGYSDDAEVPDCRIGGLEIKDNFFGYAGSGMRETILAA